MCPLCGGTNGDEVSRIDNGKGRTQVNVICSHCGNRYSYFEASPITQPVDYTEGDPPFTYDRGFYVGQRNRTNGGK